MHIVHAVLSVLLLSACREVLMCLLLLILSLSLHFNIHFSTWTRVSRYQNVCPGFCWSKV